MSEMSDQMAATMDAMAAQVPEVVVVCSYAYKDETGTKTCAMSGVATELRGAAQYAPDGQWIQDGLSVTVKLADVFPVWPKPGDVVDVRRGNEADVPYVVKNAQPMLQTLLNLTLDKRYK